MAEDYRAALGSLRGPKGPMRRGITTGTCAAAAALAAARLLLEGIECGRVELPLPKSRKAWSRRVISIPVASVRREGATARAEVTKDGGDDGDATSGLPIAAVVRRLESGGGSAAVAVRGGPGVGVVTRPGLPVPVGEAAINPVPRRMIRELLLPLAARYGKLEVTIEVVGGEEAAKKTWNPRIGIRDGISIIGTSGVVEPASSAAFKRSLYRTVKAYAGRGLRSLAITPGYVGEAFLIKEGCPDDEILTVGDHVGFALDLCARYGFESIHLAAHLGKLVKVAAGIFNTHARYGDARLETLAAHAGALGAPAPLVERLVSLKLAEEAVPLLLEAGLGGVFHRVAERAAERAHERCGLTVRCTALDLSGAPLAAASPRERPGVLPSSGEVRLAAATLTVVGMGPGPGDYLLPSAESAIAAAALLAGDERHLEPWKRRYPRKSFLPFTGGLEPFLDALATSLAEGKGPAALLVSGDPCLYSIRSAAERRFGADDLAVVPGLSSFQLACARFSVSYDDGELFSVHGRPLSVLERLGGDRTAIILCDNSNTPAAVARALAGRLGGGRRFLAAEKLGYPEERLADTTLAEGQHLDFGGLSVCILPVERKQTGGE